MICIMISIMLCRLSLPENILTPEYTHINKYNK